MLCRSRCRFRCRCMDSMPRLDIQCTPFHCNLVHTSRMTRRQSQEGIGKCRFPVDRRSNNHHFGTNIFLDTMHCSTPVSNCHTDLPPSILLRHSGHKHTLRFHRRPSCNSHEGCKEHSYRQDKFACSLYPNGDNRTDGTIPPEPQRFASSHDDRRGSKRKQKAGRESKSHGGIRYNGSTE